MERGVYTISDTLRESDGFRMVARLRAIEGVLLAKKAVVICGRVVCSYLGAPFREAFNSKTKTGALSRGRDHDIATC